MQHIWGYVYHTPTTPTTGKNNFGNFDPFWMKLGGDHPNHLSSPIPSWNQVLFRFLKLFSLELLEMLMILIISIYVTDCFQVILKDFLLYLSPCIDVPCTE